MPSVFEQLKGIKHTRPVNTLLVPKNSVSPQKQDIVSLWQKDPSAQNTKKVLQMLKPTIDSALHSYTPGQEDTYRLKATSIALQSLKSYDRTKAASPATFVFTNLQRLNRIRRERQTPVHIPESQVYAFQLLQKKSAQLQDKLGRQPTQEQLSDYTGLSKKKIEKVRNGNTSYLSQSSTADIESGADLIGQPGESQKDFYNYVYDSVSPADKKIMQWTSGYGSKQLSNNQIATKLHMSPGAVSQHKAKIQQLLGRVRGLL